MNKDYRLAEQLQHLPEGTFIGQVRGMWIMAQTDQYGALTRQVQFTSLTELGNHVEVEASIERVRQQQQRVAEQELQDLLHGGRR